MTDRIVITPAERRLAVLKVIQSAHRRLLLSPVQCDDRRVLEAIQAACRRGVRVEALLTRRTKGRSSLKLLRLLLEAVGVRVWRYAGPHGTYHAKYAVADDHSALVGSSNFTRRCFTRTCDFLLATSDRAVVAGLTALFAADCDASSTSLPRELSTRLIVGPGNARGQMKQLLEEAQRRICLIDPKLSDPDMLAVLRAKAAAGTSVTVLRGLPDSGLAPHGKLLVVDDRLAIVGSMALSTSNLDERREVGVWVTDRRIVRSLLQLFPETLHRNPVRLGRLQHAVSAA